jgi:hypothetical protein
MPESDTGTPGIQGGGAGRSKKATRSRRGTATAVVGPLLLVVGLGLGASAAAGATSSPGGPPGKAASAAADGQVEATTYYKFGSTIPDSACCQQRVSGPGRWLVEPSNVLLSIPTLLLGGFGLFRWKRTGMAFNFLFGILASYGVFSVLYHARMENGYYRMKDVSLSMLQSFIIIMLSHSLYLYRIAHRGVLTSRGYAIWASTITLVFTVYPAVVHVAGESTEKPSVAWKVFDLLWIVVAFQLILIWRRRHNWPNTEPNSRAFRLVWYAMATCAAAYGCWLLDRYICGTNVRWLATLYLHGVWHVLISLSFYFMISLARFFSAHEYGYEAVLEYFPARGPLRLPFIEWRPPLNAGTGASPAFRQPSTAPARVPSRPETVVSR